MAENMQIKCFMQPYMPHMCYITLCGMAQKKGLHKP